MIYRFIIFLILNFAAIGLSRFMGGEGPKSEWYRALETAPWSPSGWVVGLAWTVVMIGFSLYLAYLWPAVSNKKILVGLLVLHYVLTLSYNPTFFYYQKVLPGLFIISVLTLIIGFIAVYYWKTLELKSVLIIPYFLWMIIATSLNAYILLKN